MRNPVIKKKKSYKWKKWLPIVLMLLMVLPSFIYFTGVDEKISVDIEMRARGYLIDEERISVPQNTSLINAMSKYNPQIYGGRIYCVGNLCIDEGNWSFYANGQEIDPFEYFLKDQDNILMVFE